MVVETGDNVLIGGFIVYGTGQKTVAVRAIGPSLPVPGALSDPVLELHDASGAMIATNDNWRTSQQTAIIAAGLAPGDDRDSALITTLADRQLHRRRARSEQCDRSRNRRSLRFG